MSDWRVAQRDQHEAHVRDIIDQNLYLTDVLQLPEHERKVITAIALTVLSDVHATLLGEPTVANTSARVSAWVGALTHE